eukprot:TRINITY_DN26629_c0_g1_i1.p1 TRINITY_DN26629_c0_g1~~TRINITY_DN26629_c0_g1_i1.p1  ORF type:complete len:599 (-),score=95.19 TRINITY_DN26629_c0_g1_i1:167-1963(-)
MARTMEDLKAPASTWAAEIQNYERTKRRVVDEGLVYSRQPTVKGGEIRRQERMFDPLLQRYRDDRTELHQRTSEERERVGHLNRAQDISILRGQPFNILTHESKLEALAPGVDPERMAPKRPRNKLAGRPGAAEPDSALDYNILSNIPHEHHHWAPPEARPHIAHRKPRERTVPAFLVKDFNIISNRYADAHEDRMRCDKELNILEAAKKYSKSNKFDPIAQQFNDPREEERARTCDDARDVELVMRAENLIPPSYKGRQAAFYDIMSHQVNDPAMVKMYDTLESERKARYKNRHIVEHNCHAQDIKRDHIVESRKLNNIAPERYQEDAMRGYDILNGKRYGKGHQEKYLHEPSTRPRMTPWEKVQAGHAAPQETYNVGVGAEQDVGYLDSLDGLYYAHEKRERSAPPSAMASSAPPKSQRHRGSSPTGAASSSSRSKRMSASASQVARISAPAAQVSPSAAAATPASASRAPAAPAQEILRDNAPARSEPRRQVAQIAAPMPPGRTAPVPQDAYREPSEASRQGRHDATRVAPARGMQETGGGVGLSHSYSAPTIRAASLGNTAVGATLRRPTPAAPPAPAIPGSPGGGSVYSRPTM